MYTFASTTALRYNLQETNGERMLMVITKALKAMQDKQGLSNADVARGSGKSRQFVNDAYNRDDMRVSNACRFAEAMGCEIVLRKAGESDGIVITSAG